MRDLIRRFPAILLGLGLSVGASGSVRDDCPEFGGGAVSQTGG